MLYFNTEHLTLNAAEQKTYDSSLNLYGWLQMVLIAGLICAAVPIFMSVYAYVKFGSPEQIVDDTQTDIAIAELLFSLSTLAYLILTALTAILYLVWCNKSYKNLSALRITGMEFTPAQSVYLCFVPFLNFVRPFQILRELLAATSLSPVLTKVSPRVDQKPLVIYLWWTCVVVSMILNRVNSHRALNESNEQTLQMFGNASDIIQSLFWIAAGISLLYLLHTIHAQQIEQFKYVVRDDAHTGIVE